MNWSRKFGAGFLSFLMALSSGTAVRAEETIDEMPESEDITEQAEEAEAEIPASAATDDLNSRIAALPAALIASGDIYSDVHELLSIKEAYDALGEEEQAQVNYAKVESLLDYNSTDLDPANLEKGNTLEGKVIGYLGSSITQGFRSNGVAFPEYIAQLSGSTTIKQAVPGGTLALKEGYREEICYINQLHNGALTDVEHLDALVVQLSTNDVGAGIPIGELSDSFAAADQDYRTILGAMEYITAFAKEKWDCPVMYYINAYLPDSVIDQYANGDEATAQLLHEQYQDMYEQMIDALYQVAGKWGLGVADLWNDEYVRSADLAINNFFMDDPIHPHKAGYYFWYTQPIMEALEEIIAADEADDAAYVVANDYGFGYDKTAETDEYDEAVSFAVPSFIIYPDSRLSASQAQALMEQMGVIDCVDRLHAKAFVVNPVTGTYSSKDADAFLEVIDTLTALSLNIKVIGIGNGATFVNNEISQKDWAVSGIMTYGGEAGPAPKYSVPAYISGSDAAAAYVQTNSATAKSAKGNLTVYTNPDNKFEIVVENKAEETLGQAFANAWDNVFVKNGKVGNITGTWYSNVHANERQYEYFTYYDSAALGLTRTVVNDVDFDGDGMMNLWYEYVPNSVSRARAGTVPMVLLLHGNTNDPRTQINTSGWAPLAAKEGIILVEAEWQGGVVGTTRYDNMTDDENGILAMLEKVFEKYPAIDRERVYVEGLSAGSAKTLTLCLTHPEYFAGGGSHSGAVLGSSAALEEAVEKLAADYDIPWFFIGGEKDGFVPVSEKGGAGSGVLAALNLFEKMNEMDITAWEDCDESKVEWFGFTKMEDFGEVENAGACTVKGGTIKRADGNAMLSFNAVENWGHWNYEAGAELMWNFLKEHTLSEEKTIVEETPFGYVYDRTAYNTVDGRLPYITPIYLIYPDARVDRYGAEALLNELGIIEHINEYDSKAYVINPVNRAWEDRADTENYLSVLDQLGFAGNVKVIGIGAGADFVDKNVSKNAWAVAGIMSYNSKANVKGTTIEVPAYVSNGVNAVNQYYISSNAAEQTGTGGGVTLYQNPDNELINVAIGNETSMAEAFANAWKYVFSKNYRMYNEEEECYTAGLTKYRDPYQINPYPMFDELKLSFNSRTGLFTANATEERPNQWYEVFPEEIGTAAEHSIPLLVVLHGNGNDNRTQIESSGWATKAGKERIAIVAAEWQASRNTVIFGNYTALGEQGTVDLVKKVLEENPALDPGRVYVQGLSAGASSTYNYGINHNDVFTAVQGSSAPGMGGSAAMMAKGEEIREAGTMIPAYVLAGTKDVYKPIPTTRGNGLIRAYAAANGIDTPEELDFTANKYYGLPLENQGYYNINGQNVLAGTLSNDLGVMMKVVAMEPYAHWNNPAMVDDVWEFWSQYRRNQETGKIEMVGQEEDINDTIVEDTAFGYVYDRTAYNTVDGRLPYITPIYLIFPDARLDRKGAEALLYELDIVKHIDEYDAKAYVINPYNRAWEDRADTENFLSVLDQLGFAGNVKVIGIGNGAAFVDKNISKNAWAIAGIMSYNSKANVKGTTIEVPAYVSNGYNAVAQYYIASNSAESCGSENSVELYRNPDNELINVGVGNETSMAEAFANAWKYVFSKNYRMYNEEEECYTAGLTKYRDPYQINPYPMFDELGLTFNSRTGLITANATEAKPNQWYEVFPEEIDTAEANSIPLLVVLHGNGNDNRTQIESSGWATKAGKERIAIVAAEWQASRNTVIFGNYTALGEQGTVDLVKKVLEENPALDPGRVYVQGLSAGANSAYTYALNHSDVFTASSGSSSPFMTGSAALTQKANEVRELKTYLPTYVIAGTADVYKPIPTTRGNGLLQAYAAINDIDVPAEMDFTANKYYGIQLDNQGYYSINGQNVLAGTLSNDLGVMMKVVAMEPYAHWNNPALVDDVWEFWSQYRRNPETGKIEMVSGEDDRFADVRDESKYYYNAVYWARDLGITKGY
ncbi:MAG: hypothetical protein IJ252_10535, partial [Solobacterium sp.]|nr:hypothetical protein [Solobacterium sp.]